MKNVLLIVLITLACSPVYAQRASGADLPKGKVYTYKTTDGVAREMEIYFPKGHDASKKAVPGIILFHGGGWGRGSREAFSYQCDYFASRGMVAATVTVYVCLSCIEIPYAETFGIMPSTNCRLFRHA